MKKISKSKIVVATHSRIYSASQALRDYLEEQNCPFLLYISHPLSSQDMKKREKSYGQISKEKKVTKKFRARLSFENLGINSFYESYLTLKWVFKTRQLFDLFVGVDNLNAFHGLILKKLGRVKKVVYYTIDYFPQRFENRSLNWLYFLIDKICVKYCDETWNVSSMMVAAREKHHQMDRQIYNRQYTVPIGIWFNRAPRKKYSQIDKKKLVFVGHLLPHMGVDLVIKALPEIAKEIPQVKLEVIGGGEEEKPLKKLAKKLKINQRVKFYGWIKDRQRLEEIISTGAVGMATFNTQILDDKVKNADPGKIKDYLLLGLPVIVSNAISNPSAIDKKCGLVIKYQKENLVKAVVKLLKDENLLRKYRKNALEYVKHFDYQRIFAPNLKRVLKA